MDVDLIGREYGDSDEGGGISLSHVDGGVSRLENLSQMVEQYQSVFITTEHLLVGRLRVPFRAYGEVSKQSSK
jgi:hypothetical protein